MTAYLIPLSAVASQTLSLTLLGNAIRLDIFQRSTGLYMNVWLNDVLTVAGAICQNRNPVIHATYLGIGGDFLFVDTQGGNDPAYDGLGDRYALYFVPEGS